MEKVADKQRKYTPSHKGCVFVDNAETREKRKNEWNVMMLLAREHAKNDWR